ncbi:MAG: SDR family NAD(P)-dependent oxidoreductase [Hylemonella sp.]|uniref:SDR family NAD(P)-dependent oxidoreductase n=1 Tax=Hylemonella sp. TaxID=2066020 RepID=UPI0022C3E07A|nr:SDR family NAD(P)-dependent oxidoreductase [Hylemonella sp.]MCZ8252154.1 SDR family NAD(P)-dependent oxidoreductase [Hylemonella sp.]
MNTPPLTRPPGTPSGATAQLPPIGAVRTAATAQRERYGPWAVVTGASDGIGRAFARALAAAGLNLVLVARRAHELEALARELAAQHAIDCRVLAVDLADRDAMLQLQDATWELDVGLMVACAGFGSAGPLLEQEAATEAAMVDVNCRAVLQQCWHFGRRFAARGRGGVVLMSSLVAFHGTPWSANYAATKAYVQSLAEALAHEWQSQHIDVIACAPGPVASGFARRAGMQMARADRPQVVAERTLALLGRRHTVRPGTLSKVLGWSLATAPRGLRVAIMGRIMRGMAAAPVEPGRAA